MNGPGGSTNSKGIRRENLAVPDSKLSLRLDTDRLSLEPVRLADAEDMFEIMRDPAIGALMGEPPPESVAVMRERIEEWIRGPGPQKDERWLNWLARTHEGSSVAHLAATVQGSSAWLAWVVAVKTQRRGFATEAARAIMGYLSKSGVGAFAASIPEGHAASEGVARNLGLAMTDEVVGGERVWRTLGSGGQSTRA
jgi:RimJ/RimL family protein N-acetyltransferase